MEIEKWLKNPKTEDGDIIIWLINGAVNVKETARQIRIFAEMGVSGICLRAGRGCEVDYTSSEWMEFVKQCVYEVKKYRLKLYLSDDVCLSGTGGGLATANPRFRARYITYEILSGNDFDFCAYGSELIAAYGINTMRNDSGEEKLAYYYKINNLLELRRGDSVMAIKKVDSKARSEYNGSYEPDMLSRECFDYFMTVRHEKYKEELKEYFGTVICGIFTEGNMATHKIKDGKLARPYNDRVEEEFYNRYGYSLISRLPELFLTNIGEDFSVTSQRYCETVKSMYEKNRLIPYYEWCKTNKIKLCSLQHGGEDLYGEGEACADRMRVLSYCDVPAVVAKDNGSATFKYSELKSLKEQEGKALAMCEVFSGMGNKATFEDYRIGMEITSMFGVDKRLLASALYTVSGEGKREENCIASHSAYYENVKLVTQYGARLNMLNKNSQSLTQNLVIYGAEDVSAKVSRAQSEKNNAVFDAIYAFFEDNSVDFDLGNENVIARNGSVSGIGKKTRLVIGEAEYSTVFVAGLQSISKTTLKLLTEFAKSGGTCVFVENLPTYVDGNYVDIKKLPLYAHSKVRSIGQGLLEDVETFIPFAVYGGEDGDICLRLRRFADGSLYAYAFNRNSEKTIRSTLVFGGVWMVKTLDIINGTAEVAEHVAEEDKTAVTHEFTPLGSLALRLIPNDLSLTVAKPKKKRIQAGEKIKLPESFAYDLSEPNVLVLDTPTVYVNGRLKGMGEITSVADFLKEQYSLPANGGLQPWYKARVLKIDKRTKVANLTLKYEFEIKEKPAKLRLALERPELFEVVLNGRNVEVIKSGAYLDSAIEKINVPTELLVLGKNELVLNCELTDELPLEPVYLLGNFGVNLIRKDGEYDAYEITALPKTLSLGDVTAQGLPFYGGKIYYYLPLEQGAYSFKFSKKHSWALVRLRTVDVCKDIAFMPFEDEIYCDFAERDFERIEGLEEKSIYESDPVVGVQIEVTLSRRNTLGPLRSPSNCARSARAGYEKTDSVKPISLQESGLDYLLVKRLPLGLNKEQAE